MSSDNSVPEIRQIRRLLVANRGEIARRIFRTARAMGMETVAVFSDGDADEPFVAEADRAVALGGRSAADSYLDTAKVLDAARRSGADAVHPGYGFLSENAAFATAVINAGLIWVGPPPQAIAAMGDKLEAKRRMIVAGVPTLPSVEINTGVDLAAKAAEIGYPVLIKAAAGGGGKGMRVVASPAELDDAVAGASREALNSFGDGTVFLEKYLQAARHVEIQVLGDQHGNLIHCFERECSIQRRHQKVVEEAPSPAVNAELRAAMGAAGVAAVRAIGYYSAGTVEFLLDDETNHFYFLEVNTRLQVEHPVTEMITGLDLVRQMLRVSSGHPLDVSQDDLSINGHAIEVRLYAEDPANNFLPAVGRLVGWAPPVAPVARVDSGVEVGSVIGVDFDPMLAKVIVHAPTRDEAAAGLASVLERFVIAGVVTNRDFLVSTLRAPEFLAGDTHTDFIERVSPLTRYEPTVDELADSMIAVLLVRQARNRETATRLRFLPSGYRNSAMPQQRLRCMLGGDQHDLHYRSERTGSFTARLDAGEPRSARLVTLTCADGEGLSARVAADIDGVRLAFEVIHDGSAWHVHSTAGAVTLAEVSPFPEIGVEAVVGGQTAPMPGAIRVVAVRVGDTVSAGQTLVVMEAMKMEHTISAPGAAVVAEVRCVVGDQVDNGQVLVVLEPI